MTLAVRRRPARDDDPPARLDPHLRALPQAAGALDVHREAGAGEHVVAARLDVSEQLDGAVEAALVVT